MYPDKALAKGNLSVFNPNWLKIMLLYWLKIFYDKLEILSYVVAPYGYNDFFDIFQLFCCNGKPRLGIGNIARNIPSFESLYCNFEACRRFRIIFLSA